MKEQHLDLFVDLLVEKVNLLQAKIDELEAKELFETEADECHDDLMAQITDLKEKLHIAEDENSRLCKQLSENKEQKRSGDLNTYKMMVQYAKAKGFKFLRLDKMKQFIENPDKEQTVQNEPENVQSVEENVQKVPENVQKEPMKIDFDGHTSCPNKMHNQAGKLIEVGGRECKRCAFNKGINYDEAYVECKMRKD